MVAVLINVLVIHHNAPGGIAANVANAISVIVLVALIRHPYAARDTFVFPICVIVLTVSVSTYSSNFASVAERILIIINVSNTLDFITASCAITNAVFVLFDTNVY